MGRPSKLTPDQWREIERRVASGEVVRAIAREFGVSEAAIRKRGISAQSAQVRSIAEKIAAAHSEMATLPVPQQALAMSLADEMRAVSANLASAARYGSATAQRLAHAAHQEVERADVLDEGTLRAVAMITRTANEAGQLGVQLLKANETTLKEDAEREAKRVAQVTRIKLVPMAAP